MPTTNQKRSFLPGLRLATSASKLMPTMQDLEMLQPETQSPGNSLIASAARITRETLKGGAVKKSSKGGQGVGWQEDAWAMFDLVGELHFIVTNIAARASKARLYAGKQSGQTDRPEELNDPKMQAILEAVGDGPQGMSQLLERLVLNLQVTGEGWLVGIPSQMMPRSQGGDGTSVDGNYDRPAGLKIVDRTIRNQPVVQSQGNLDAYEWRMLSIDEIQFGTDTVQIELGPLTEERLTVNPDDIYLIRTWAPHPRKMWEADSATRSSLPVLRELVGLTMHVSAQVDSRLAGAGILVVSDELSKAAKRAAGLAEDSDVDPFTDALIESMLTPISDRESAAAVVPLVVTAPGSAQDAMQHISFTQALDGQSIALRKEAIERLAFGLNTPPELLLGSGGMNHWGGWLMREDVISSHIEPILALICDSWTSQYFRPVLVANGMSEEEAAEYVVWYDVEHLVMRPNKAEEARDLYNLGVLSDDALRSANGFDETDAPDEDTDDPAVMAAFDMVKSNPGLLRRPGLDVIVNQLRALLKGEPLGAIDGATQKQAAQEVSGDGEDATDAGASGRAPSAEKSAPAVRTAASPLPEMRGIITELRGTGIRGSLSAKIEGESE